MKKYKFKIALLFLLVAFISCDDLEYIPKDQLSSEIVVNDPILLQNVTYGTYAQLKANNYMAPTRRQIEYGSDDMIMHKTTGANLMFTYNYDHIVNSSESINSWKLGYQAIYSTNVVIEAIDESETDPNLRQILGENYFLRALVHFDLVKIFGRPYTNGDPNTNLGVMIRDNTRSDVLPPRSTVKECYDFIVADLLKAIELMNEPKPNIYASKEVAKALLARAYLYMGDNENALIYADKVIDSGRYELLPYEDYKSYFTFIPENNRETIFANKLMAYENYARASIGSMFNGNGGWGEVFPSPTYRDLVYKYSEDARINFIEPNFVFDEDGNKIPDPTEHAGYQVRQIDGLSSYFHVKYTNEDGIQMLSSVIRLRLAEMYLIKAEAYAKTDEDAKAIEMVDILRQRAGLSGDQLFANDMQGYTSVMDIVMDERRLELAWEGHRKIDIFRNNRTLERDYLPVGVEWHGPRAIPPTSDRIVHYIPDSEIILNPNLVQNP